MEQTKKFSIGKRRYIGCKAKLADWIMQIIETETSDIYSFCDIFAGTAIISDIAIKRYNKVIINDFLYSNNIIYKAFYSIGKVDHQKINNYINALNQIDPTSIEDNYFSENYGDKFFDFQTSKKIGYIRDNIEKHKDLFSDKEYCILIASLIYSIDKISNTLGHYEAYIKKEIKPQKLMLRLIDYKSIDYVEIYREDSNQLVKKISADIFYIDPPYNSR